MRRIFPLIGLIAVVVLIIVVIVSFSQPKTTLVPAVDLTDYFNTDARMVYIHEGIINADENHRAIRITVSNTSRSIEILSGYQGDVIKREIYANNSEAFNAFLAALQSAGFVTQRKNVSTEIVDSVCPLGNRYIFRADGVDGVPNELWSTNCGKSKGSFGGTLTTVQQLFKKQIPNYTKVIQGVNLNL